MWLEKFTGMLLGTILVVFIIGFTQPVFSDHLLDGQGVFLEEDRVNLITSKDSKYQIHLQVEIRDSDDQLISVSEIDRGEFIPHEITDEAFNHGFPKKEIIIVNGMKYEKGQLTRVLTAAEVLKSTPKESTFVGQWWFAICGEFVGHSHTCIPVFSVTDSLAYVESDDIVKQKWTVLREYR